MSNGSIDDLFVDLQVDVINLNKCTALFRRCGIPTTETKLADGIEQGVYDFGVCIRSPKGSRQFEIYRKLVIEYLRARAR